MTCNKKLSNMSAKFFENLNVFTLYLLVLDKRLNLPGTEQKTSPGEPIILRPIWSFLISGKNGGESVRENQI